MIIMAYPKGRIYPEKITFMVELGTKEKIRERAEVKGQVMSEWLRDILKAELT